MPRLQYEVCGTDGKSFHTTLKAHSLSFKNFNSNSKFTQHLQETGISFDSIDEIMEVLESYK